MRNLNWIGDHINFSPPCYRSSSDPCSHHKMCPEGALNLGASPASRQIPKTIKYIYTTGMIFHLSMHIRYIHCINKTSFFNTFPFQSYHREKGIFYLFGKCLPASFVEVSSQSVDQADSKVCLVANIMEVGESIQHNTNQTSLHHKVIL